MGETPAAGMDSDETVVVVQVTADVLEADAVVGEETGSVGGGAR